MATQLAGSSRFIGEANEALVSLVNTGRISGDQLGSFGQVALEMAKDTGRSIADVTADLARWRTTPRPGRRNTRNDTIS